ncbi:MAG: hypothetical protein HYU28_02205 [Actinobacteria bacterium]|nr:hypothetical protein [Actinomycetota bacterium]
MTSTRTRIRVGVAALALAAVVVATPTATAESAQPATGGAASEAVDHLLIISLPHLTWEVYAEADAPNLDRLLEDSAVGGLAVRVKRRKTETASGYTTLGAGTRAPAPPEAGHVLGPDEDFDGTVARAEYARRMGHGSSANVLVLSMPAYVKRQSRELFDAEAGALGQALSDAGVHRAVIGNSDRLVDTTDADSYSRPLAAALMDFEGRVPGGRVDRGLLVRDDGSPFGVRLDAEAVEHTFEAEWAAQERSVVLVEASDLVRAEAYRTVIRASLKDPLAAQSVEAADRLVGRLLRHVDLTRDAVLVVAPASPSASAELTLVGVRAPGVEPSLLTSATTRRDGFVTIYDLGPGIVELMGVERPESMEGRPFEGGRTGGDFGDRVDFLVRENAEALFRDDAVSVMSALQVALELAISLLGWLVLRFRRFDRGRSPVAVFALVVLALLPMTYLAGLIDFADLGFVAYVPFVFGGALALTALAWMLGRRDALSTAGWVLFVVVGVIVGTTLFSDTELLFNTAFGDSPIVAGRFVGINNLTFSQLAAGGIILSVLLAHRLRARRGAIAAAGLLAFLLLVDGLPAWGADVGGVLTAVPAFGYVAYRLFGARLRLRTLIVIGVATVVVIGAFTAFDLAQPADQRTHLGRLYEQVDAQGGGAFVTVILRKLAANLRVITSSIWLFLVPGALAFVAYVLGRRPRLVQVIEERIPAFDVALGGLLIAGVLGFALNDSGIAVPGMVLGVLNPVLVHLSMRLQE